MTTRKGFFATVAAVLSGTAVSAAVKPVAPPRKRWETKEYFFDYHTPTAKHDECVRALGLDGWEFVTFAHNTAFFKEGAVTPGFDEYSLEYYHDGARWTVNLWATSFEDAEARAKQLYWAKVSRFHGSISAAIPGAGLWMRLMCWWGNIWRKR